MEWPFRRFSKAYNAFQRRTLCDEWKLRKATHIAATFANTNLDDEKNDRTAIVAKLEESYNATIALIWNGPEDESEVADDGWSNPFMRAGRHALGSVQPMMMPGEKAIGALPG